MVKSENSIDNLKCTIMKRLLFGFLFTAGLLAFTNSNAQVYVQGRITIGSPLPQVYCAPQAAVYPAPYVSPYYRERVVVTAPGYGRRYYDRDRYYDDRRYDRNRYDDRDRCDDRGHKWKHWKNRY
jgi:hypothetical protein